jgi:hypothetical protein
MMFLYQNDCYSGGHNSYRNASMQSEKTSSGQTTWRAGRRERYGFAVVSGDRAAVA